METKTMALTGVLALLMVSSGFNLAVDETAYSEYAGHTKIGFP